MALDYNDLLYAKMKIEFDDYCNALKDMPVEQIIGASYETVMKKDLLCCIENGGLSQDKAKALCALKHPLEEIYSEWLHNDLSYMDLLRTTVDNRANTAAAKMQQAMKLDVGHIR